MDFNALHAKWQKVWEEAGVFEPEAGKGEKFYLTAAFPYPNSPQHIGHARTYTTTDIYARYQRMKGKNVLFPMAFHVTGTPILAMAKRIEAKDRELFEIFDKIYGIAPQTTQTLTEPKDLVMFFSKEIEAGMKEMGYSIDWRRKFYTFDAVFNKFIQWQFRKLHEAGYITKGSHPVPWCPRDRQPVGGHDTQGDVDPELEEVTAVLFGAGEGFIPAITYRPETLPGVTNLWVNPNAGYVLADATIDKRNKKLYLTKEAFDSLAHQLALVKIKDVKAEELLALKAVHPLTKRPLQILPASFVDPATGTGLVMSVPAHAPYDYLALKDLNMLSAIPPIQVLDTPGFGACPAGELCAKLGVKNQQDPKAEEATKQLYKLEAHEGKMKAAPYAGMNGIAAKEKIKEDLVRAGSALSLHILANAPVFCRCGASCVVKQVENQWFINYGDGKWKEKTREALADMRIMPEGLRHDYEYTIGWLRQKACTRASGLGTRFPFDESQMIEALSDSTIYMAFYTIAHIVKRMGAEKIDDEFFDFVFFGKEPKENGKKTDDWAAARSEFLYWYPLDSRHSAHDLVHNHLTFFIFNHTAIFEKKHWPRQTVSNGFVTMEGRKMSKSMGNILPLRKAIARYGTDVIRFVVTSSAELEADSDFNQAAAEGVIGRLNMLENYLERAMANNAPTGRERAARWFYSRFHSRLRDAARQYENFELRPLARALLYDTANDLQWYSRRSSALDLREFFEYWTLMAAPFMPHVAEEFWARMGEKKKYAAASKLVVAAPFPMPDEKQIEPRLEMGERHLQDVMEDVRHILQLLKREKAQSITLIVHAPWKMKARMLVAKHKNIKSVMEEAKKDAALAMRQPQVAQLAGKLIKNIGSVTGEALEAGEEKRVLDEAKEFLSSEFGGAQVVVLDENDAPPALAAKAANALPGKPSIVIA
ncbi:MAG: leucine--tRNA ligase [Candidatus Marsarchaeota archaeon]|nr:leucine--tRNA ligase [Candidatus Marsarchaeota archaeon]